MNWTQRGTVTLTGLPTSVLIGVAYTSHVDGTIGSATLDNISVTGDTPPTPDTTAPTVPTNLQATALSSSRIDLTWTASTDAGGSGLSGYRIFRDGGATPIATVTTTSYSDTGLAASTLYTYTVRAVDGATNVSANSSLRIGHDAVAAGAGHDAAGRSGQSAGHGSRRHRASI